VRDPNASNAWTIQGEIGENEMCLMKAEHEKNHKIKSGRMEIVTAMPSILAAKFAFLCIIFVIFTKQIVNPQADSMIMYVTFAFPLQKR
jgi:hypothetical protein